MSLKNFLMNERGIIRLLRRLGLSQTLIKKSLEIFPRTGQTEKEAQLASRLVLQR